MFPMTMTIHNQAQLAAVLAVLSGPAAAHPAPEPTTSDLVQIAQARAADKETAAAPVEKPKTVGKASAPTAPTSPTAEVESADAPVPKETGASATIPPASAPAAKPAATSEPIAYEVVAKAITEGVKVNRQKVVDALAKFGAKKGPDLKPAQYADFMAALEA